jgi:hypothetical protein
MLDFDGAALFVEIGQINFHPVSSQIQPSVKLPFRFKMGTFFVNRMQGLKKNSTC